MAATHTAMTATAAAAMERGMRENNTVMMHQDGSRTGMQWTAT
jgi:hypothetical protein